MLRYKNKTSKKPPPTTPPYHKLITNKSARMKYQRRKTVPTLRKLVSDGREVSTGDAQSRGANRAKQDRQRGTTGAKGHAEAAGRGRGSQGQAERNDGGLDSGREVREGPAGSTRLRAAPLASPPTFSGPRTRLRPPASAG